MNAQEQHWAGEEGNAYLARNRVDWRARVPFWRSAIGITKPDNVLEVGCNAGWNMRAIREVSPGTYVEGVDINHRAVLEAKGVGLRASCMPADNVSFPISTPFDLIFTAGVLIHVAPEALAVTMRTIADASTRWVLAVEYAADHEEMVEYRGQSERLWKRPFGALYEAMGLTLAGHGDAGEGFDRCHYWLMEKPQVYGGAAGGVMRGAG